MGCIQSRPVLARIEEGIFFLGSIYSTIISYVSHFLNRFYNLLLSPLFHLDGNVPSRLCDDRGVCYRPKDRLMQKRKIDERIKRAEYAAKGLDPKLALRPKESRNASTTDLASSEKAATALTPTPSPPLWVMGNVAPRESREGKPRPVSTEKPRRVSGHATVSHPLEDESAAAKRKRRQSAPVHVLDGARRKYHYEVLATSDKEPRDRKFSNTVAASAGMMDGSFATAADRLKSHHRRSLQVVEEKTAVRKQHGRHSPNGRASPAPRTLGTTSAADTDAAGILPAPPARSSFSAPQRTSTEVSLATGSSPYGNSASPRGSIADLASAAAKSKNTKDRKAWRGEISKVAKTRVAPSPAAGGVGATMGRFGGSPLAGEVASSQTSPDLQGFHAPHRAQTFA